MPRRIDDEVSGDAVAEAARDLDGLSRLPDGRVLHESLEPFVGGRFEPEENVEVARDRPPRLQQLRMPRHRIHPALHEHPRFPDPACAQRARQFQASRRVVPEEIVGHEHVAANGGQVIADRTDRPLADGPRVKLPDRAERATERTAARGFDQPRRPMREARVLATPGCDVMAGGMRHQVELEGIASIARRGRPDPGAIRSPDGDPWHRGQRLPPLERFDDSWHRPLAVVQHDGVDRGSSERCGIRRRGVPADNQRHVRGDGTDPRDQVEHVVGLERVHRGDADDARPLAEIPLDAAGEAQVGERHLMAACLERSGDVLHPERLDAEERTEAEALVTRDRPQQEDAHRSGRRG